MAETSADVAGEFFIRMNDLAGFHGITLFSVVQLMPQYAEYLASTVENFGEDSSLFLGHGDPNQDGAAHLRWRFSELPDHLAVDGTIGRALGQQWIVMVATEWGDHYRARFATAEGVDANDIQDAGMADMNRMRNDVIHHGGIASRRKTGRCEVFKWFEPGDAIIPRMWHVSQFMDYLGLMHIGADVGGGPWVQVDPAD